MLIRLGRELPLHLLKTREEAKSGNEKLKKIENKFQKTENKLFKLAKKIQIP